MVLTKKVMFVWGKKNM